MKRSNLRDRMLQSLRQMELPRGIRGRKLSEGVSRLPLRDLIRFLESTGDEQVECAKRCLWKISFNSPLFPPAILFRSILDLQTKEKALDQGKEHRSRDHIRHIVYLTILGIYIFTIDPNVQRRFDRQASYQKRRNNLGVSNNADQFIQAWLSFCIFHDIGYPVERLHSTSSEEVKKSISDGGVLDVYTDLVDAYAEEYATRALANLSALVSLLDFDDGSFEHLVLPHLKDTQVAKLKDACKPADTEEGRTSKILYKILLASKPISLFSPPFARLLTLLLNSRVLLAVLESEASGDILWLGTIDRSIDIICDSSKVSSDDAWQAAFGSGTQDGDSCSVKYYPTSSLSNEDIISAVIPGAIAHNDVAQICKDLQGIEEFRHAARTTERQVGTLAGVSYSALCGTGFVDHSLPNRFGEIESAVAARSAIEQHENAILLQITKGFGQSLQARLQKRTFLPTDTIRTKDPTKAYSMITSDALELDKMLEIMSAELGKCKPDVVLDKLRIDAMVKSIRTQFQETSSTFDLVQESLLKEIRPSLEESVRRTKAINRIFGAWLPSIREILERSLSSTDMDSVSALTKVDLKSPDFIRKLFSDEGFSQESPMLSEADQSLLQEIGRDYKPIWQVDHGLYAAAIGLWSSSLRWSVTNSNPVRKVGASENDISNAKLVRLIMFNPVFRYEKTATEINDLKNATDLCYRSIALHNFYPKLSRSYKGYKHKLGSNPFTYVALLSDALQNWDRDVQYNPGKFDLTDIKPDSLYDIYYESGRLRVVVNRLFFDEARVVKLREDLAGYLCDLDTIMDIRLG